LLAFAKGRFNALIATDVVVRGLDIPNIDMVIHYELPTTSEIFAHGGESNAYTVINSSEIRILFVL
jgi:superfamily II DNA/RNA helicase